MPDTAEKTQTAPAQPEQKDTPYTGEQRAEDQQAQAEETHKQTAEALEPNKDTTYGAEPIPLESNPPVDQANDIVNSHTEAVSNADESDSGLSKGGNQPSPSYQPPVTTLQDGENLDDPEARVDVTQTSDESASTQSSAENVPQPSAQQSAQPSTEGKSKKDKDK
jgi:hypothetical protein